MKKLSDILSLLKYDLLFFGGLFGSSYGVYLLHKPSALIYAGVLLMVFAIYSAR